METTTIRTEALEPYGQRWQPVAYVALDDPVARQRIETVLRVAGWMMIAQPTGFHLIRSIAGVIEGDQAWLRPSLIVVDANARGCMGTSIAAGLRELGISIPIVLVAHPDLARPISPDYTLRIVDAQSAPQTVAELAATAALVPHRPAA